MGVRNKMGRAVRKGEGRNGLIMFVNGSQAQIKKEDMVDPGPGWLAVTHYPNMEVTVYNLSHILWIRWYD